jgi:hypothetical protein
MTFRSARGDTLIYKEIQMGSGAASYMRKVFLIYEEMRKYLITYEEAVSHMYTVKRPYFDTFFSEDRVFLQNMFW